MLVTVTLAAGIAAPDWSVMVPEIRPRLPCAESEALSKNIPTSKAKICGARRLRAGAVKIDFANARLIETSQGKTRAQGKNVHALTTKLWNASIRWYSCQRKLIAKGAVYISNSRQRLRARLYSARLQVTLSESSDFRRFLAINGERARRAWQLARSRDEGRAMEKLR